MGDTFGDGDSDEKPVHEVCVDNFYLGKYEVTQGQWQIVMGSNPSRFKECGSNCPVEKVSWNDAQEFIKKLNVALGREYPGGGNGFERLYWEATHQYRLPTEAEWEYAARSGGKREKWAGTSQEEELGQYAWYENASDRPHPVGRKKPNSLGLYDMSGNVAEWCADRYNETYYQYSPKNDPGGPEGKGRTVLRGGSFWNNSWGLRTARRESIIGADWNDRDDSGFRMALSFP